MNRLLAMLAVCAMTALEGVALELQDVPDQTIVYTIDDPFAIGVSTASYTICTNLQSRMTIVEAAVAEPVALQSWTTNRIEIARTNAVDATARADANQAAGVASNALAVAAAAYSATNKPPALTNYLFGAVYTNGAWWAVKINP